MRALTHVESTFDVDAVLDQLVDLSEKRLGIEHNAVSDRAAHTLVENAARDLVQHERVRAEVHGMSGIRPALIAHDPIRTLGEHVDQFALPFVAPLRANDDNGAIALTEHETIRVGWARGRGAIRAVGGQKNTPRGQCPGR